jgi:hypothetical protein
MSVTWLSTALLPSIPQFFRRFLLHTTPSSCGIPTLFD